MSCPCGIEREHAHCVFCTDPMSVLPLDVKLAEFVKNFHRQPTQAEMEQGTCCDDCYQEILAIDRAGRN